MDKAERFKRYGWKINEKNLQTLPPDAPESAQDLVKWLTLEGRRSSLQEWINCVSDDSRIHGKFWHIGSWTHRMSHSNPNQANIFSPFHGDPETAVEEVKSEYDAKLRALWDVEDGYLVGTDAEGIQLRILAHYLENEEYIEAIVNGKKEDETDIHNVNKRALGPICKDRDTAKTFIYAFLLGAGIPKIAEILKTNNSKASTAINNFYDSIEGLRRLKKRKIPYDARREYFVGLDGRKVKCNSEHLMLAGYLQNGEAVVMKHANVLWRSWLDNTDIKYRQVDFVHDEWQTQVYGTYEEAEEVGRLQRLAIEQTGRDLGVMCPLAGSTDIGKNWLQTH